MSAAKIADVPVEEERERLVTLTATGDLWIHGVSSPKKVTIAATFAGSDGEAPAFTSSSEPVRASLHEHDVKPRDLAGKFLAGALEQVGQKIDDIAQISFDLRAEKPQ